MGKGSRKALFGDKAGNVVVGRQPVPPVTAIVRDGHAPDFTVVLVIVGNVASEGGGIRNNDPSPLILNSTIAYNTGSGISSRKGSAPVIHNSIVWGNTAGSFSSQSARSSIVTYSDIEGGFPGDGNLSVDPLFVDPAGHDFHIDPASPLIDMGSSHPDLPPTDYDGNPRIIGSAVDMGAFEFGGTGGGGNPPPVASFALPACTGLTCAFTDTSTDFDGSVVSWSWEFGDGAVSTVQHPTHAYSAYGDYAVTLAVTDDNGDSDAVTQNITLSDGAELVVNSISPSSVQLPIRFVATIGGTGFGDDAQVSLSNGSGPTPTVTDVSVVDSSTITATITVKSGGPPKPRSWDVTVTSGGASATLPAGLTVLP